MNNQFPVSSKTGSGLGDSGKRSNGPARAFITADYDGSDVSTMRGFVVEIDGHKPEKFTNMDVAETYARRHVDTVLCSSSVHDYFSDLRKRA